MKLPCLIKIPLSLQKGQLVSGPLPSYSRTLLCSVLASSLTGADVGPGPEARSHDQAHGQEELCRLFQKGVGGGTLGAPGKHHVISLCGTMW